MLMRGDVMGSGIARGARALLAISIGSLLLAACGSSSSSTSTTTAQPQAPVQHTVTLRLHGVAGKKATIASVARLPTGRREVAHARLSGLTGQTLTQKLQTLANLTASFWGQEFQASNLQLPAATVNIIGDTPVSCGSSQIITSGPPTYCVPTQSIELTLNNIQTSIEPLGDAATALLVADLYGYHVENALNLLTSSSLSPAQLKTTDSCFSGVFFSYLMAENALGPGDEAAVDKLIAKLGGASSNGSTSVTADQLSTAFNQGILSRGNAGVCLPKGSSG
jgi:hypothetical protein